MLFIAIRLAKLGYYNGNPEKVLKSPVTMVLHILEYEAFQNDIEKVYIDMRQNQ